MESHCENHIYRPIIPRDEVRPLCRHPRLERSFQHLANNCLYLASSIVAGHSASRSHRPLVSRHTNCKDRYSEIIVAGMKLRTTDPDQSQGSSVNTEAAPNRPLGISPGHRPPRLLANWDGRLGLRSSRDGTSDNDAPRSPARTQVARGHVCGFCAALCQLTAIKEADPDLRTPAPRLVSASSQGRSGARRVHTIDSALRRQLRNNPRALLLAHRPGVHPPSRAYPRTTCMAPGFSRR